MERQTMNIIMMILAHNDQESLADMVKNIRYFCPKVTLCLYNSGNYLSLGSGLNLEIFPSPRRLDYAKISPFFFDTFEWLLAENRRFDYVINLETDILFVRKGFETFISQVMADSDYMAPNFSRFTSSKSKWRPIRSLRPELAEWYKLLGFEYTHGAFSPGQVFSRNYIEKLLRHEQYAEIQRLVKSNQSYTLQEVLFPTLVDFLKVRGKSYPSELKPIIRYRPYQAINGVRCALAIPDAYFVHPVRRELDDPARLFIHSLIEK